MKRKAAVKKKAPAATSPAEGLPPGLAKPAVRALVGAGYTKLNQLAKVSDDELLELHGMGPNALTTLRTALKGRGKKRG